MSAHSTPTVTTMTNRRKTRHRPERPVYVECSGDAQKATFETWEILDLSEEGVALQGGTPLEAGREVHLRLQLDTSAIKVCAIAKVIWSDACGRSGLHFIQLSSGHITSLRQWLFVNTFSIRDDPRFFGGENPAAREPTQSHRNALNTLAALRQLQQKIAFVGSDFASALNLVVGAAHELLGGAAVAIAVLTDVADVLVCRARCGSCAPPLGSQLHVGWGFSGRCVRSRTPLICADTEKDIRVDAEECRSLGVRSLLAVPVRAGSVVLGLIEAFSSQPFAFVNDDIVVLESLAGTLVDLVQKQTSETEVATQRFDFSPVSGGLPAAAKENFATLEHIARGSPTHRFGLVPMIPAAGIVVCMLVLFSLWVEPHVPRHRQPEITGTRTAPLAADRAVLPTLSGMPFNVEEWDLATLQRRANEGDIAAESTLAQNYLDGEQSAGLRPDEKQAARWFSAAAEQGNVTAQSRLAYLFWNGRGVRQDPEKAYFWAAVASRNSRSSPSDPAVILAQTLKRVLSYSSLNPDRAATIERRAARWQPRNSKDSRPPH